MLLAAGKGISENVATATALSDKVLYYQLQVKVAVKTNRTWVQKLSKKSKKKIKKLKTCEIKM